MSFDACILASEINLGREFKNHKEVDPPDLWQNK